jgi:hypothetical protein
MKRYGIQLPVNREAYTAFQKLAIEKNYHVSGLFREYLRFVLERHNENPSIILPATTSHTPRLGKEGERTPQLAAQFSTTAVRSALIRALLHFIGHENNGIGCSRNYFLHTELVNWFQIQGLDLSIAQVVPSKKVKQ